MTNCFRGDTAPRHHAERGLQWGFDLVGTCASPQSDALDVACLSARSQLWILMSTTATERQDLLWDDTTCDCSFRHTQSPALAGTRREDDERRVVAMITVFNISAGTGRAAGPHRAAYRAVDVYRSCRALQTRVEILISAQF